MRRFASSLMLTAGLALAWCATAHAQVTYRWVTEPLLWSNGAAEKTFAAVDDTARTKIFDASNLAWDALVQNATSATGAGITITGSTTAAGQDSFYYGVELGMNGRWQRLDPFDTGATSIAGMFASGSVGQTAGLTGNGKFFQGAILYDTNTMSMTSATALNNVWEKPKWRLFVRNGHVGTAALTNLRLWITYPKRVYGGITWAPVPLKWSTGLYTATLAAAGDSARTAEINLSNAQWNAFSGHAPQATTPIAAQVVFTTTAGAPVDSIYYTWENGWNGTFQRAGHTQIGAASANNSSLSVGYTSTAALAYGVRIAGVSEAGNVFFGYLTSSPNIFSGAATNNNIYGKPAGRILVKPPTSGSFTGLQAWLIYPHTAP